MNNLDLKQEAYPLRRGLPPLPPRMQKLPVDPRGYPIPWFVAVVNGKHDFRVMDDEKRVRAIKNNHCWVCGGQLGTYKAFVTGPMCIVTGSSAEPPSHFDCALFSVRACPFMLLPKSERRTPPPGALSPGGIMIESNPGMAAILVTKTYNILMDKAGTGFVLQMGPPSNGRMDQFRNAGGWTVEWFTQGRLATRAEVTECITTRVPLLVESVKNPSQIELDALQVMVNDVLHKYLPLD